MAIVKGFIEVEFDDQLTSVRQICMDIRDIFEGTLTATELPSINIENNTGNIVM